MNTTSMVTTALVLFATAAAGMRAQGVGELPVAARAAMDAGDAARADAAIAALREAGPGGLAAFLDAHRELAAVDGVPTAEVARFRSVLDRIGAQRDNWAARLYWFTDLDRAKAEARRTGKPIVSLRLLGRLDEELSCANSRFFRTALYANATVGALLREGFVLHWESERPAPRVSIDFGDGRRLERTITGNSIHYVLDHEGHVIDALPGLYGPVPFARELENVRSFFLALTPDARSSAGLAHVGRVLERLCSPASGRELAASLRGAPTVGALAVPDRPPADVAGMRAVSKVAVERPLLPVAMGAPVDVPPAFDDSYIVTKPEEYRLDDSSLHLLRSKCAPEVAGDAAAMQRMVAAFERSMAVDTVRNDLGARSVILAYLVQTGAALPELNRWVYASVFATPATDPWLGLVPADIFTAIEGGGVVTGVEKAGSPR